MTWGGMSIDMTQYVLHTFSLVLIKFTNNSMSDVVQLMISSDILLFVGALF
jgi:hypothetical protein